MTQCEAKSINDLELSSDEVFTEDTLVEMTNGVPEGEDKEEVKG